MKEKKDKKMDMDYDQFKNGKNAKKIDEENKGEFG